MTIKSNIEYFPTPKGRPRGPQQMVLFNVKPQNRWHRGYTPERKAEVEAAMPDIVDLFAGSGHWRGDTPEMLKKAAERGTGDVHATVDRVMAAKRSRAKNLITRSIARSRVDPKLLRTINGIEISGIKDDSAGLFEPFSRTVTLNDYDHPDDRGLDPIHEREVTLIHELGHAHDPVFRQQAQEFQATGVDTRPEGDFGRIAGDTNLTDLRSEGYAEGYGTTNFIPRNKNKEGFFRVYDDAPIDVFSIRNPTRSPIRPAIEHPAYREGLKQGSEGALPKEEKKKPAPPAWEQLRLF